MGRAPCCDKATVKKGPWSPEEDAMLKNYIEEHGTGGNWIALPHKIGLKRCGKSCRLRWLNYLRPNIKHGDFTPEEDSIICSLYISIGSRWSIIAAQLPGRTDNDVKNYWNTKLKKRLLGRRKDRGGGHHHRSQSTADDLPAGGDGGMNDGGGGGGERSLSASAMERIQLCMQLQELQNPLSIHHNPLLSHQWPSKATIDDQNHNNVTVAEHGMSSSVSDHHRLDGQQLESGAGAAAMQQASPSSGGENSNVVVAIEAELQELLYAGGGAIVDGGAPPQGDVDWWSYDQGKQSPVTCWDFTPETSSIFQDYATVYDI
ncbi:transcription factor MYB36 [Oryza sativa Japonica Group]|jgi:myb proto-oncogene protein|uniref:Os08g0248700 protein n=5 Tax=Oryza TaxID=4527 RepID=Q6Z0A5_ORYSJ|nr:transcription factor MYB36 [Oryza sativa Japonica Group]KAB8107932.1 hypothetical protein EE612_043099 [Oryza sativa]KAF2918807.1 hypothetical protein DAI22_08g084800 [Oryza sativa Japonica Group]BAD05679.1 putative P-type R2R3 Myb protein [Oryza sativa Japonica Group]BAF23280.1 Os08g0248700 [Oryza sativa Japonica Group]BAG99421.1 unnamed protein product [Oryza sativa Japonica Group]|eukprot:NP_001061366.1 Os08g0248700 [Oryza sativa Japonica Group]